jgi:hypothetical protein
VSAFLTLRINNDAGRSRNQNDGGSSSGQQTLPSTRRACHSTILLSSSHSWSLHHGLFIQDAFRRWRDAIHRQKRQDGFKNNKEKKRGGHSVAVNLSMARLAKQMKKCLSNLEFD